MNNDRLKDERLVPFRHLTQPMADILGQTASRHILRVIIISAVMSAAFKGTPKDLRIDVEVSEM